MSKQKQAVLNLIQEHAGSHLSADEIYQALQKKGTSISLATVYRNLASLSKENQILPIHIPGDMDRYDSSLHPHAHLICTQCGCIEDIDTDEILPSIQSLANGHVQNFELVLFGLCTSCQKKNAKRTD
jgi:Fe2+ or Zn2+ uptake regulation protein